MTPKELYELACECGCENEEIILYDGDNRWILEPYLVGLIEREGEKAICIKEV